MKPPGSCGTCYACCVEIGIEALKKYPCQACKNLSGADPEKRCTIYPTRPVACSRYKCLYIQSDLPIEFRPNNSGMIVTCYSTGPTILIFDHKKSGSLDQEGSLLNEMLQMIYLATEFPHEQIRIFDLRTHRGYVIQNGQIFLAKEHPGKKGDYEGLTFEAYSPPIGRVHVKELVK